MLLEWLINTIMNSFSSILTVFTVQFFSMVSFPESYMQIFFDFIHVAFFFLPVSVLPIFILVPAIWTFRITNSVVTNVLSLISNIPIIGWISG